MRLKEHRGFKRLAVLISLVSFIIAYIFLFINERMVNEKEAFLVFPIIAAIIALATFVFVRIIYWVADGFKNEQ